MSSSRPRVREIRDQVVALEAGWERALLRVSVAVAAARRDAAGVDVDSPGGGARRRKGWITDPTGETVVGRSTSKGQRALDDVRDYLESAMVSLQLVEGWIEEWAPVAVERRLCGDMSPSSVRRHPEFDGACRQVVEHEFGDDGAVSWRRSGLCPRCRKRLERYDREHASVS